MLCNGANGCQLGQRRYMNTDHDEDDTCLFQRHTFVFSLIASLLFFLGFKCPVCSKSVASNEMEVHFIMCLSKPRLSYNGMEGFFYFCSLYLYIICQEDAVDLKGKTRLAAVLVENKQIFTQFFFSMYFSIFIGLPNIVPCLQSLLLC